jgi:aryl-alcohol dehydrogenase-like predicted oxidoreductase
VKHVALGGSGLVVSRVGLGCNNFGRAGSSTADAEGTARVVDAAIECGVTFFDTADVYGAEPGLSESLLGSALRGKRDRVIVATKFGLSHPSEARPDWERRSSRSYIRRAVEASLRRLGTDWIDLYQLHSPDPRTPIEETLDTLGDLVKEGLVRYIGSSNLAGWQIVQAEYAARAMGSAAARFVSSQNEYSLLRRDAEREVLPAVEAAGVSFLPYYPLFNGVFSGKYTESGGPAGSRIMMDRPHVLDQVPWGAFEEFRRFCAARGVSVLQATYSWLLSRPGLASVIAGATTAEQIGQNTEAGEAVMSQEDLAAIDRLFPASV